MPVTIPAQWYEQLLREAKFGPVHLGADAAVVFEALGAPEDEGEAGRSMRIVAFGAKHIQVTFRKGRVVHIGLYFRDEKRDPIVLPKLELSSTTSVGALCDWMRAAGQACYEDVQDDTTQIRCSNGVSAVFVGDCLDSLQIIGGEDATPRRAPR